MKDQFYLDERVTFKYNDGFSHEDLWETIGTATVEAVTAHNEDHATLLVTCTTNEPCSMQRVRRALKANYSISGCGCSHDCCGCTTVYPNVTFLTKMGDTFYFQIELEYSRNY